MKGTFNVKHYEIRVQELTERAKAGDDKTDDTDIGEEAYLTALRVYVEQYHEGRLSREKLIFHQKTLRLKLEKYYQQTEMFDRHVIIRNHCSEILTEAEKYGCPICRKLVRIFDERDNNEAEG